MSGHATVPRSLHGTRILLVEEDDQLYQALKEVLMDAGSEVLGAVVLMPKCPGLIPLAHIDVAVMDASCTKGHVSLIASELRARGIPAVFITPEPLRATQPGELTFLAKPFTGEQLIASVVKVLGPLDYDKATP